MLLHIRGISFKRTFLFVLYSTYTIGACVFAGLLMFGPESIAKSILISLPAFIGLTPILIAVVIYTLNLFMRILPWHICIEVVNTDQSGKVLVTNRIVNTIRR